MSLFKAIASTDVRATPSAEPSQQRSLWSFAAPLIVSTSLYWFQVQGYRIELEHWVDTSAVGLLMTGLLLGANPVNIIDTLLTEYLRPQYYRAIACGDRAVQEAAWRAMAGTFLTSLLPIAVLGGFSGGFLASLLVGPSFRSVAGLVGWGVLIEILRATNALYLVAAQTRFHTRATVWPAVVGAAIVAVAILPLARWNLYAGTGVALAMGMAGSTVYLAVRLRPVFRTHIPYGQILRAGVRSVPVGAFLVAAQIAFHHPSQAQALVVLALAGLITLCVQISLGRGWLPKHTTFVQEG